MQQLPLNCLLDYWKSRHSILMLQRQTQNMKKVIPPLKSAISPNRDPILSAKQPGKPVFKNLKRNSTTHSTLNNFESCWHERKIKQRLGKVWRPWLTHQSVFTAMNFFGNAHFSCEWNVFCLAPHNHIFAFVTPSSAVKGFFFSAQLPQGLSDRWLAMWSVATINNQRVVS